MSIFEAAAEGDVDKIKELLAEGVDVNKTDEDGWTALHHAALNGKLAAVQVLLQAKANPNITLDENQYTPLHTATIQNHEEIIEALLEAEANIEAVNSVGQTALHIAAKNGYNRALTLLLDDSGGKEALNKKDDMNWSAADCAIFSQHPKALEILLNKEIKVDQQTLKLAVLTGNVGAISLLQKSGLDLQAPDATGQNSLHYAYQGMVEERGSNLGVVKLLESLGVTPITDDEGRSPSDLLGEIE